MRLECISPVRRITLKCSSITVYRRDDALMSGRGLHVSPTGWSGKKCGCGIIFAADHQGALVIDGLVPEGQRVSCFDDVLVHLDSTPIHVGPGSAEASGQLRTGDVLVKVNPYSSFCIIQCTRASPGHAALRMIIQVDGCHVYCKSERCASSRKNVRSRVHRRSAKEHTYRARTRIYIDTRFSGIQKQNRSPSQCSEARSFLRWSTTGEIWRLQAVWGRARACLRFLVGVHARSLRQSDDLCFLHNRSRLKGDRQ